LTRRTLEILAQVRQRWLERVAGSVTGSDDPLLVGLQNTLPGLAAGLTDPEPSARQSSLNVLETLGPAAAPALPELVKALDDSDRFVRWGAARALGKIGGPAAPALPGLTRLLRDSDLDLQLAAVTALEQFGPAAVPALPALVSVGQRHNAPELRVAAIHALEAIGLPGLVPAIPALAAAVADADGQVRLAAIALLGKLGPAAQEAVDALRQASMDRTPEVQQEATAALLQILEPPIRDASQKR